MSQDFLSHAAPPSFGGHRPFRSVVGRLALVIALLVVAGWSARTASTAPSAPALVATVGGGGQVTLLSNSKDTAPVVRVSIPLAPGGEVTGEVTLESRGVGRVYAHMGGFRTTGADLSKILHLTVDDHDLGTVYSGALSDFRSRSFCGGVIPWRCPLWVPLERHTYTFLVTLPVHARNRYQGATLEFDIDWILELHRGN